MRPIRYYGSVSPTYQEVAVPARLQNISPDHVLDPVAQEILDAVKAYATCAGGKETPAMAEFLEAQHEMDSIDADADMPTIKLAEERLWQAEEALRAERSTGMHRIWFEVDLLFDEALYESKRVMGWTKLQRRHAGEGQEEAVRSTMQYRIERHKARCGVCWDEPR